jgi:hypothetical protein
VSQALPDWGSHFLAFLSLAQILFVGAFAPLFAGLVYWVARRSQAAQAAEAPAPKAI